MATKSVKDDSPKGSQNTGSKQNPNEGTSKNKRSQSKSTADGETGSNKTSKKEK